MFFHENFGTRVAFGCCYENADATLFRPACFAV